MQTRDKNRISNQWIRFTWACSVEDLIQSRLSFRACKLRFDQFSSAIAVVYWRELHASLHPCYRVNRDQPWFSLAPLTFTTPFVIPLAPLTFLHPFMLLSIILFVSSTLASSIYYSYPEKSSLATHHILTISPLIGNYPNFFPKKNINRFFRMSRCLI